MNNADLPAYLIEYDHNKPSKLFTKQQIEFIESITSDFSIEEMAKIRKLEWFRLNLNRGVLGCGVVPGLRPERATGCLYFKRFSKKDAESMAKDLVQNIPTDFPERSRDNWVLQPYRVITANKDRYYPLEFHNDIEQWRERLQKNAGIKQTLLAYFDQGKFMISNGEKIPFSQLLVEVAEHIAYPEDW